jgi:hypothetical protein
MMVSNNEMNDVLNTIRNMDGEQVSQLVEAIKLRRTRISRTAVGGLNVGDNVKFTGRSGETVHGTVLKKAIKNVTVDTVNGRWKVPASMLSPA